MIDISVQNIEKYYDEDHRILDKITFDVFEGERVGLLGKNGAGKTTLFKIISGELGYEGGTFAIPRGKHLGVLDQLPDVPENFTVNDVLLTAYERADYYASEMKRLETLMAENASERVMKEYAAASERFEAYGGYDRKVETNKVCAGLGIPDSMRNQLFIKLSGGEQTRVNLARLILLKSDILLLDEPTNHLDINATIWLESFLKQFKGTVLVISHDRYFLDQTVTRIIEINKGKAEIYNGNYSAFAIEKQRRYEEQLERYEAEQRKVKQLAYTAERMHGWAQRNAKLHKRAFAIEKRMERISQTDKPDKERSMKVRFKEISFESDEVIKARQLQKQFGNKLLFQNLDLDIIGGEHIALLGSNGSGKTTLVKILNGEETTDEGFVKIGPSVKAAVMPQKIVFSHPERTLVDTVIYALNCSPQTARDRLGAFQFKGEDVFKTVDLLSGGERSRLWLCCIMADGINLLYLDEPTNHLDIASREWIEEAVENYQGTLIFVSHDRYFIQRFADRILEFKNGSIYDFRGSYDELLKYREREAQLQNSIKTVSQEKTVKQKPAGNKDDKTTKKEIRSLELQIEKIEKQITEVETLIEENANDYEKLQDLIQQQEELNTQRDQLYDKWSNLVE